MKVDFKKSLATYSAKRGQFQLVEVPSLQYLMVDGHGDPNVAKAYREAIEALYPVAYTLKFTSKKQLDRDYVAPPLEALWWADDMATFTTQRDKSQWSWTAMLMVPDWLDADAFARARDAVQAKSTPAALDRIRLETMTEGLCVQTLHLGPYDDEGPVLAQMHDEFIPSQGLTMTGKHHEIYLSDPRKSDASRLRTILRQPVAPA